ncbi:MAG: hypothetical protein HYS33_07320 [Acidobacteria bacterium]|nr:hypothetical protein [Acidobacteriota bacterium]MBI1983696.1 hypothetical protein [Acidobacteriota bacterium]
MIKKTLLLVAIWVAALLVASGNFAAAQHEGHGEGAPTPATDGAPPPARGHETPCQKVARLAKELDGEFDALLGVTEHAELRSQLSRHKVKLQDLREATGTCSQQCEKRSRRKGCGHMMQH